MMEKISRLIRANAIDYEEYFNQAISANPAMIGEKYGCYAARFYDPGITFTNYSDNSTTTGQFGAQCYNTNDDKLEDFIGQPDCVLLPDTQDTNTGEHPYKNCPDTDLANANAFCPQGGNTPSANEFDTSSSACFGTESSYTRKNLFLINPQGNVKTIIGRKQVKASPNPEFAIAQLEIQGTETIQDGITENWSNCSNGTNTFCCTEEYDCNFGDSPPTSILKNLTPSNPSTDLYKGFLPISPLRSNIEHLSFTISPSENPGLAFIEEGAKIQPTVTVTLTLSPSADQRSRFGNDVEIPRITLQTTITPRTYDLIPSFTGPDLNTRCAGLL
jgi:hypothetical protein